MEGARNMATLSIRIDDRLDAELRDVAARDGESSPVRSTNPSCEKQAHG